MRIVAPHIVEVVVLAGHPHALLRIDGAFVRTLVGAENTSLNCTMPELVNSSVASPPGTSEEDGTAVCPCSTKKS